MAEILHSRSEELAEMLRPILHLLHILMKEFTLDELKSILSKLEDFTATQRAFPFPETQNQADLNEKKNKLFEAIIKLAER